jgi:hypothetical protein
MNIQGVYSHQHDPNLPFNPKPASATVDCINGRITRLVLTGRPYHSAEDYKNLRSTTLSNRHLQHIQSVELIKKHLIHAYTKSGQHIDTQQKAHFWAQKIFREFQ